MDVLVHVMDCVGIFDMWLMAQAGGVHLVACIC